MKKSNRLVIIGAGIGGLYSGYKLQDFFDEVLIVDKSKEVGGLARSVKYKNDYIEKFYHYYGPETPFIFELLEELDLKDSIKWTDVKRGSFIDDKFHPMEKPLDLLRFNKIPFFSRIKLGLMVVLTRYFLKWEKIDHLTAKDFLLRMLDKKTYEILWKPLFDLKFKEFQDQIPAPFLWSRLKIQTEKIAYIEGGLNESINKLEDAFLSKNGKTLLNTEVKSIEVVDNQVTGIKLEDGTFIEADTVLTTVPTPILKNLCEFDGQEKELIDEKEWMGVVCAVLLMKKKFSNFMWLNVISKQIPFVGVIDYTLLNPNYKADGCNIVYVPDYVSTSHEHYKMDEDSFKKKVYENLKKINPEFDESWVSECFVFKAPYAQNISFTNFGDRIVPINSNINGLYINDWSQFYPWDRGLSNSIKIAKEAIEIIKKDKLR